MISDIFAALVAKLEKSHIWFLISMDLVLRAAVVTKSLNSIYLTFNLGIFV